MTDALTIRRYEPDDREDVQRVHERALRASPLDSVAVAPAVVDVQGNYLEEGGEFLVGTVDGEIVAVGGFRRMDATTVELERLRVHPEHRRNGYGERLFRELERRARGRGVERLVLDTDARLAAARRLYEKLGYEQTRIENDDESAVDVVYYEKVVDDG